MTSQAAQAEALNDFADHYRRTITLLLAGDTRGAGTVLATVPGSATCAETEKRVLPPERQLRVFLRDGFECRYCRRRTVFVPALRALSNLFPDQLPYHIHGKMTDCHVAFWRDIASCDHLLPVARGGSSGLENLVTACYMCNSIKQNWLVEELRWTVRPIQTSDWDGLVGVYPQLLALLPAPLPSYHVKWLRAINQVQGTL